MRQMIPCFENWPRRLARRTWRGYKVWALQNKHDGHCIYNAKVVAAKYYVYAYGKSEQTKYGKGSFESVTKTYENVVDFMADWGLK